MTVMHFGNEYEIDTFGELRLFVSEMIKEGFEILSYGTLEKFFSDNSFYSSDFENDYWIYKDDLLRTYCDKLGTEQQLHDNEYYYCEYTRAYYHVDDLVSIENAGNYCSENYAHSNFYYHDGDGWYTFPNEEEEDEDNENYISPYHSGGTHWHNYSGKSETSIFFGVEIEKEDEDVLNSINISEFKERYNDWRKESDGSLNDSGFELISPIFPLDIPYFVDYVKNNPVLLNHVMAESSKRCGGHINISENNKTPDQLFDRIQWYVPLLYALYPNRKTIDYCQSKSIDRIKQDKRKYGAIYIKSECIEIRIFPAIKNLNQLEFRLKIIEMMCNNHVSDFAHMRQVIADSYDLFSMVYDKIKFLAMLSRLDAEILTELNNQQTTKDN
jgi:hypothetical protein